MAERPIKLNIGKYMTALTASNSDLDLHPLIRTTLQTTRTWNDSFYPVGDPRRGATTCRTATCELRTRTLECGAMDNQNFGKETFTKIFDPELIHGWGKRTYNWEMGVSVQQELLPRVGLTVGYVRRWFGNFYTADNTHAPLPRDYTPFSIPIPVDPRLPGGGGGTVNGLYNLVPDKVGQEDMYQRLASNFGEHDRELARHRSEPQRAAAQRSDRCKGGTSTGAPPAGQLRNSARASGDLLLGQHDCGPDDARHDDDGRDRDLGAPELLLPRRRTDATVVSRAGDLICHSEDRRPSERHVAERPGKRAAG